MEKVLRIFDDHATADHATRAGNIQLTCLQRFEALMEIMSPYYEAAGGLQRICRIVELSEVVDDGPWEVLHKSDRP